MDAKKYLGQNFITDKNLILKIISLLNNDGDTLVIEIGPGRGALTTTLVEQFKKVVAIEIDKDLETGLRERITNPNFQLIMGDVLELDLAKIITEQRDGIKNVVLISNTPYYITSEILFRTFRLHKILAQAVFMFQNEVAQRICATPGHHAYNNLSITTNFYAMPKYEFIVRKKMFNPVPAVDSAMVSLDFTKNSVGLVENDLEFVAMVRSLFNNRRKTILNNVKTQLVEVNAVELLETCGIDSQKRPENLTMEEFVKIYNTTKK